MSKLELKHLAPYLPYGLKGVVREPHYLKIDNPIGELINIQITEGGVMLKICSDINNGTFINRGEYVGSECWIFDFKPILRPLSQLTEEIEHNGEKFVPMEKIFSTYRLHYGWDYSNVSDLEIWVFTEGGNPTDEVMTLNDFSKLFEWHFDVFGLIEQGLAIKKT